MMPLDDDGPVAEQGAAAPLVLRLSKTAGGVRTYTVGAAVPVEGDARPYVDRLFELERLVVQRMEHPVRSTSRGPSVAAALRRSLIMERIKGAADTQPRGHDWLTTAEIVQAVKGHRSQVVADLSALVADGLVEYQRGKGGTNPSRYRLAAKGGGK